MSLRSNQAKTFGALATMLVGSLLLGTQSAWADAANDDFGRVQGVAVQAVAGVDHAVEYYAGSPEARTTSDQLKALSVSVAPEDKVTVFPDPSLGLGSALTVKRATVVTVVDGATPHTYRTWTGTVSDLFAEQHIDLGKDDSIDINKTDPIVNNMKITITRVAITTVDETEPISFSSTSVNDNTMDKGTTRLIQAGKDGVRTKTYQVRRENGVEVSRTLIDNQVTTPPVTEQKAIGTKVVVYGTGTATWYNRPGDSFGAASNTLPYGTKVHVVNVANGKSVDVTIDDHGIQGSAIIDLDQPAFAQIGSLGTGVLSVRLEKYYGN